MIRFLAFVLILAGLIAAIPWAIQHGEKSQVLIYNTGDLVRLKSGGPAMTVNSPVYNNRWVTVDWMDNIGQPQHGWFDQKMVEKIEP